MNDKNCRPLTRMISDSNRWPVAEPYLQFAPFRLFSPENANGHQHVYSLVELLILHFRNLTVLPSNIQNCTVSLVFVCLSVLPTCQSRQLQRLQLPRTAWRSQEKFRHKFLVAQQHYRPVCVFFLFFSFYVHKSQRQTQKLN